MHLIIKCSVCKLNDSAFAKATAIFHTVKENKQAKPNNIFIFIRMLFCRVLLHILLCHNDSQSLVFLLFRCHFAWLDAQQLCVSCWLFVRFFHQFSWEARRTKCFPSWFFLCVCTFSVSFFFLSLFFFSSSFIFHF